jgi:hypothetical protein
MNEMELVDRVDALESAIRKSEVITSLKDSVEQADENIRWISESLKRLRDNKGDPKKIAQSELWLAHAVETKIQCSEVLKLVGAS